MTVDKNSVIPQLHELAVLLDLCGENAFKVNAFRNAARNLAAAPESLENLLANDTLKDIKGFGKSIVAHVQEIVDGGGKPCVALRELREKVPAGLVDMLRIEGFGAKKARAVWNKLGLTTLGELEYACRENRLAPLPGFGAKSQEKILKGIEVLAGYTGRFLQSVARHASEPILAELQALPAVQRAALAGSLRRCRETVKDIDLIASSADPAAVMARFVELAGAGAVIAHGATKSAIRLPNQLQVDLRVVEDRQFPYVLHHFTGSKEHNVALRGRAQKRGFKMNEYGLFKGEAQELIECADEAEIFRALGLAYIPPEMREDMGELALAETGEIPELVTRADLRGMIHVHTTYSDGRSSVEQMALAARDMGFEYIGICDHSQSAAYAGGLSPERVGQQHAEIDAVNERLSGIRILKGIESDIHPDGALDYDDDLLARFELVIASVHSRFNLSAAEQTRRLVAAVKNPRTQILGHPTGRLLLGREGYPLDLPEVLRAAAGEGKPVELNASPHRLDLDWRDLLAARELGLKISINPDAHSIEGMHDIDYGIGIARKAWRRPADVVNTLPVDEFIKALS